MTWWAWLGLGGALRELCLDKRIAERRRFGFADQPFTGPPLQPLLRRARLFDRVLVYHRKDGAEPLG